MKRPIDEARRREVREGWQRETGRPWPTTPDGEPCAVLLDTDIDWSIHATKDSHPRPGVRQA